MIRILYCFSLFILCACRPGQQKVLSVFEGKARINGPYVTGNYPGTPFLFAVPTAGERPVVWTAEGLPPGLQLDPATGFITGMAKQEGVYTVSITAKNKLGRSTSVLTIKIDSVLALTPPMGWNSWNTFEEKISDSLIRAIADAMVASGMRDLGYLYVNIDDLWQLADRDEEGNMQADPVKFPEGIKAVADYVHSKGLKLGIYSDASEKTCGGVAGSYGFEERDARLFAEWGIDLLKYDYCGAPRVTDSAVARYERMAKALRNTGRSIVFNICQWGAFNSRPWKWAAGIGGNYWRTTWDIRNTWVMRNDPGHCSIMDILDINAPLGEFAGPGRWNDPDMLVVGINDPDATVTVSPDQGKPLTTIEQQSHMSLWCLMAAPLLCGNDIRSMDPATKAILLNPEIIAINQDPLGKQAAIARKDSLAEILVKQLTGQSLAVGLLNRSGKPGVIKVSWKEMNISGPYMVYDVWRHRDVAQAEKFLEATVPAHGCKVFKLTKK
ncbi:putative Ig domain-containing protein [Chitinophaga alhagiae]|uniref:putative Ig domain-containing protein n=1 Tax=Chitinophaga alhagiae TaxID=2203219 RepID=UPI000E5AEC29|nr:putative Ig domain-containing protein [Chitinophaga alhagiae]